MYNTTSQKMQIETQEKLFCYPFNFTLFPPCHDEFHFCKELSGNFGSQASSLRFLCENGFDPKKWIEGGISWIPHQNYLDLKSQKKIEQMATRKMPELFKYFQKEDIWPMATQKNGLNMQTTNVDKEQVGKWLNRFEQKMRDLDNEFEMVKFDDVPSLKVSRLIFEECGRCLQKLYKNASPDSRERVLARCQNLVFAQNPCRKFDFICFSNKTEAFRKLSEMLERQYLKQLDEIYGMTRLWNDLMHACHKHKLAIVMHNGMLDLAHLYNTFDASSTPRVGVDEGYLDEAEQKYQIKQQSQRSMYHKKESKREKRQEGLMPPIVIDTKYLCEVLPHPLGKYTLHNTDNRYGKTGLQRLYFKLRSNLASPVVTWHRDGRLYHSRGRPNHYSDSRSSCFHEAGYDAYCTGVVFAKMCGLLARYNYVNQSRLRFDSQKRILDDLIELD
ncbi:hypothetical protein RFI_27344, partial [Reticulomyxa filosa]